jgi:hypothetical protein
MPIDFSLTPESSSGKCSSIRRTTFFHRLCFVFETRNWKGIFSSYHEKEVLAGLIARQSLLISARQRTSLGTMVDGVSKHMPDLTVKSTLAQEKRRVQQIV